jgi:hypothetical protein
VTTVTRGAFMAAAQASLAAALPGREVMRGIQEPADLGDAALQQGVWTLVAASASGWPRILTREGRFGTLSFAAVFYGRVAEGESALALEQLEEAAELELLDWVNTTKPEPLDAVYPLRATYSQGREFPYGWVVMEMEAMYV